MLLPSPFVAAEEQDAHPRSFQILFKDSPKHFWYCQMGQESSPKILHLRSRATRADTASTAQQINVTATLHKCLLMEK